ncbi:hypothetical protein PMI08_01612 [Brevibacillus sp. CF112]|uniref:hypothetical protein n=1 Tax=Brevibacillus sp. CF112 TaxID=1144311 RepID=UPI000271D497|nr:hypothetical protein [Brevibacillus sp. CF112]EJL45727.1 hypothetical protein PMI08_01612 [Brevibacillus sp. CF112]
MKSKKRLLSGAALLSICLSATSVFAASSTWSDNGSYEKTIWWKPYSGTFNVTKDSSYPKITARIDFKYSANQKSEMMRYISYYPTYDFRDESKNGFDGSFISTNFPDPKYDYEDDNGDGKDDELEAVSRDQWSISANTNYYVTSSFGVVNTTNDPKVSSYASISVAPIYPGGDYNTVAGTAELLGVFKYSQLSTPSSVSNREALVLNTEILADREYDKIKTKGDLENYKNNVNKRVERFKSNDDYQFVITLKNPMSIDSFYDLVSDYNLEVSELYARGIDSEKNIVTIGTKTIQPEVLESIQKEASYSFKGIIEIEGTAKGKDLKKIMKNDKVFAVEVQTEDQPAFGLYWKKETLIK